MVVFSFLSAKLLKKLISYSTKKFIDESKLLSLDLEKKSQQPFKCYKSFL